MTIILGLIFILGLLVVLFQKWIRKWNIYFYGLAVAISIVSFTQETTIINMGYVGISFFFLVMIASTMEQGTIKKKLMGNRAELAVIGSIFSITHGLKYILFALDYSFFWEAPLYFYLGIISVLVMLPLAITSLMIIRKKMKGKTWKKLHKLSYVFYGLIFLHVIMITNDRMLFYIVLAGVYAVYKGLTLITKKVEVKKVKPAV